MINIFFIKNEYLNHKKMSFPDTSRDFLHKYSVIRPFTNHIEKKTIGELLKEYSILEVIFTDLPLKYSIIILIECTLMEIVIYKTYSLSFEAQQVSVCVLLNRSNREIAKAISKEIIDCFDKKIRYFYSIQDCGKLSINVIYFSGKEVKWDCGEVRKEKYDLSFMLFPTDVEKIINSYMGNKLVNDIIYKYD